MVKYHQAHIAKGKCIVVRLLKRFMVLDYPTKQSIWEELTNSKITKDTSENTTEYTDKILTVSADVQSKQAGLSKSIVLDLGWFERKSNYSSRAIE